MKTKIEYVWLDGYTPEPNLRSKVKIVNNNVWSLHDIPEWNFDGSSTKQADGSKSDCILKPVRTYSASKDEHKIYVLCEVMNPDGTPHESNDRAKLYEEDTDIWFGFEQEYFIRSIKNRQMLGHDMGFIEPQGKYYCGVGSKVAGREFVEEHLQMCLNHGIDITGINAEVALGQWEFQVFGKGKLKASDDLWMCRYFLNKLSEKYGYEIDLHPKPLRHGEWNGSGLHTNFSTGRMRDEGGEKYFKSLFSALETRKDIHIENYGSDNELRLTGKFETQSIHKFTWGVSDRGASIRVPQSTFENWKGYLEDRRPASNANPYKIVNVLVSTITLADELHTTLNNMYTDVDLNTAQERFKGLTCEELLGEYRENGEN